jgi:hypothetical protein
MIRPIDWQDLAVQMSTPFHVEEIRTLSLENHLALATMRSGRGKPEHLNQLAQIVYLAFFLRNITWPNDNEAVEQCRRAEAAISACAERVKRGGRRLLLDQEVALVENILVLHDEQLAAITRRQYLAAWEQLQPHIAANQCSPIEIGLCYQ